MYASGSLRVFLGGLLLACGCAAVGPYAEETNMTASTTPENMLQALPVEVSERDEAHGWKQQIWSGEDTRFNLETSGPDGGRCFFIGSRTGADAAWTVTVPVEVGAWYALSARIKTEDVAGATGALLNIQNMQTVRTNTVTGTRDWTRVSATFRAEAAQLEINCLFGGWGQSTGKAWYTDMSLIPAEANEATEAEFRLGAGTAGDAISAQLFGHNLEHTRRAIWRGISAEMVANRKFAAVDSGLAKHWWTSSGTGVSIDAEAAYTGEHSLRLDQPGDTQRGVWQQHDWLAFGEGEPYAFRVWARSESRQTLQMRVTTRSGFTFVFNGETTVEPGDWRLWRGTFTAPCPAKGARLEIALPTPGTVWIGAISMMPADNFHGMRRDVVDLLKGMKPGNLRWPGGCFSECYPWKDGLLPVDQRPPIAGPQGWAFLLPDTDGYDNHDIGTDEYIALCRELNAVPMITTRFSEGGPEEAADWVEYCNGAASTRWGKVRAERGHPEPYGVEYWYVGNELTGASLLQGEARTNPEVLAARCREHMDAMRNADPTIKLNAGVPGSPDWIAPFFSGSGSTPDEIQTGFYFAPDRAISMTDTLYTPLRVILPGLRDLRQSLDRVTPAGRRVGISYYEWNTMWDRSGDARSGLFVAGMLNMFLREAKALELRRTSYFQPVTEGAIHVGPRTSALDEDGQVFALYAEHQGNQLLETPTDAEAPVDVCASLSPDGNCIFATAINRNTVNECTLRIVLAGFPDPSEASAEIFVPDGTEEDSTFIRRRQTLDILDGKAALTLPPCSIAGIRLVR